MHAIYKSMSVVKVIGSALIVVLLSGCSLMAGNKPEQAIEAKPLPLPKQVVKTVEPAKEKLCACDEPVIKEVIKYVDKACPQEPPSALSVNGNVPAVAAARANDKLIVGRVEYVVLSANGLPVKARIDTGAKTSSLNALDLVEFERDGKKWVRFAVKNPATEESIFFERKVHRYVRIKQMESEFQRRPVVKMAMQLGSVDESVELTLTDRSDYVYQILVGRNFLRDRMLVDVSQKYITKRQAH